MKFPVMNLHDNCKMRNNDTGISTANTENKEICIYYPHPKMFFSVIGLGLSKIDINKIIKFSCFSA